MIALGLPRDPARRGAVLSFPDHATTTTRGQSSEADSPVWRPFPGTPQEAAYNSPASWIGYGGAAGGGKTDLLLGLAGTRHRRALILRRTFPEVRGIIERSREIFAGDESHAKDSYNEQTHIWRLASGRQIEFGSCQYDTERDKYRGRPFDLYGFDEATAFSEPLVRFITAWNRTSFPGQTLRKVLTFNPPDSEEGRWVIRFFLPWMAYLYPNLEECKAYTGTPAAPGELRYFAMVDGKEIEVPPDHPKAESRTFFPASVEDNPVYMAQGYDSRLENLPEPLRSQLRYGSFTAGITGNPYQVIPSDWVQQAIAREPPADEHPLSALGLDVARGGADQTTVAELRGPVVSLAAFPGSTTPDGPAAASVALARHRNNAPVGVDVIGVGASAYDHLVPLVPALAINAGEGTDVRDRSGQLEFINVRAAMWWVFREALDPKHGEGLILPEDQQLRAELTAPRFSIQGRRIKVESKDELRKRLGRSTDRADAVIQAYWAAKMHMPIFLFGDPDADSD